MFTNFIKLEPIHMKGSEKEKEKVISTDTILEVTKSPDGKFYLNRTGGEIIPLTERGYNFIINALDPVMDNVEIIGDGLGENQL